MFHAPKRMLEMYIWAWLMVSHSQQLKPALPEDLFSLTALSTQCGYKCQVVSPSPTAEGDCPLAIQSPPPGMFPEQSEDIPSFFRERL